MNRWKGKVAVVTGASSGIGLALSKALVQEGMIVVGLARRKELMESRMKDVDGSSCRFHPIKCDVAQEENVIDSFKWIKDTLGSTNILINNAGTAYLGKVEDTPSSLLQNVVNVNVLGLSYCSKQAIKLMKESQEESHIVNMCSVLGHTVVPAKNGLLNIYSASKFAVRALSKTLRQELLDTKIRVSNISPGMVKAAIMEPYWDAFPKLKNWPTMDPEDVADSVVHVIAAPPAVEITELTLRPKRSKSPPNRNEAQNLNESIELYSQIFDGK